MLICSKFDNSRIISGSVPTFRYHEFSHSTKNVAVLQISRPSSKTVRRSGSIRRKIGIVAEVDHMSCQLVNIMTVYTLQTLSYQFAIYKAKWQNLMQCLSDMLQNQQYGRTLCYTVLTFRYRQPLYTSKKVTFLPSCCFYLLKAKHFAMTFRQLENMQFSIAICGFLQILTAIFSIILWLILVVILSFYYR